MVTDKKENKNFSEAIEPVLPEESESLNEQNSEDYEDELTDEQISSAKNKELENLLMRERAEFINFRKRVQSEKAALEQIIAGRMLSAMVPVLDSFDQMMSSPLEDEKTARILEGVALIRKQIWNVFSDAGVEEFNPEGEVFDPASMEALSVIEDENADNETVSQVFQKGYRVSGRIIRAARVVVKKPKTASADQGVIKNVTGHSDLKGEENE